MYIYTSGAYTEIFEKGFPLQPGDCYIRVVYIYCLIALLEYLNLFTKIIIQNNAISVTFR